MKTKQKKHQRKAAPKNGPAVAAPPPTPQSAPPEPPKPETVNHPKHYNQHPSGVECIDIVEHMTFNVGTAIKHLWRAGLKGDAHVEDLKKAAWYINREIARLTRKPGEKAPDWLKWLGPSLGALFGTYAVAKAVTAPSEPR